jgi:hypothetical protein
LRSSQWTLESRTRALPQVLQSLLLAATKQCEVAVCAAPHYYAQSHTALYPFSANQSAPAWKRAQILREGTLASYGDNASSLETYGSFFRRRNTCRLGSPPKMRKSLSEVQLPRIGRPTTILPSSRITPSLTGHFHIGECSLTSIPSAHCN